VIGAKTHEKTSDLTPQQQADNATKELWNQSQRIVAACTEMIEGKTCVLRSRKNDG